MYMCGSAAFHCAAVMIVLWPNKICCFHDIPTFGISELINRSSVRCSVCVVYGVCAVWYCARVRAGGEDGETRTGNAV